MRGNATPIRLAVLLCDSLIPVLAAEFGDYYTLFSRFLTASVPPETSFVLDGYDVVKEMAYPPEPIDYDGIILTGSAANAYEKLEWINRLVAFVERVAKTKPRIKIFGVCFGHQIVARALGGECVSNGGRWEVGTTSVQLSRVGQSLFECGETLNILQSHRDHVPYVPPPFALLGSTALCPNQGMVLYDDSVSPYELPHPSSVHILTLQGHPEFTGTLSNILLDARTASGVVPQDVAKEAKKRNAALPNDGVSVIGALWWKVLGAGCT